MLTDGTVVLREVTVADIALLYAWRNDPETHPMFRDDRPLDFDSHRRFVERYSASVPGDYWWIVEAAGVPVGAIALYGFGADRRACEFGRFIIGREHRGCGYGRRALELAMRFARSLGVERISCAVLSSNEHALRLYSSLGFIAKGIEHAGERGFVLMESATAGPLDPRGLGGRRRLGACPT
jgi:RimJ/RimL family protein N-acetyltransferase